MKFQYNKVASLIGDYNELIRVTELSINSQGIAHKQTEMLLDTISSKLATVKAQLESFVVGAGNSGLTAAIKEALNDIGVFLERLSTIKEDTWKTAASMAYLAGQVRIVSFALTKLAMISALVTSAKASMTASSNAAALAETRLATMVALASVASNANASATMRMAAANEFQAIAANTATVANARNASVMTIATGGLNLLIPLLVGGAAAYTLLSTESSESVKASKAITDAHTLETAQLKDKALVIEQEIDLLENKIKLANTLASALPRLIAQMAQETEQGKDSVKTKEKIETTQKALIKTLGDEAYARIVAAGSTKEAIDKEIKAMEDKQTVLGESLKIERRAITDHTEITINKARERLDAIKAETMGLATEAQKQSIIYDSLNAAKMSKLTWERNKNKDIVDGNNGMLAAGAPFDYNTIKADEENLAKSEKALSDAKASDANSQTEIIAKGIATIKAMGNDYVPGGGLQSRGDTGTVETTEPKGGTGSADNADKTAKSIELREEKRRLAEIQHLAKLDKDIYNAKMDTLATLKEINGESPSTILDPMQARSEQWKSLDNQNKAIEIFKANIEAKMDRYIADTKALSDQLAGKDSTGGTLDYAKMSKKQKASQRAINSELNNDDAKFTSLNSLWNTADSMSSANNLEKTKLSNDNTAAQKTKKPMEVIDDKLMRAAQFTSLQSAMIDNKYSLKNDDNQAINKIAGLMAAQKIYEEKMKLQYSNLKDAKLALINEENAAEGLRDEKRIEAANNYVTAVTDEANKTLLIYMENANTIKQLEYEKNSKIRDGLYGITQDVLIQGNSLKNVWNSLWQGLANDALKQLFRIQTGSGGLLSSLFGINFGGSASSGAQSTFAGLPALPVTADGGVFDNAQTRIIGEAGEEAVINLAKLRQGDQRQKGLLSYANSKLGIPKGTNVTANVSQRTMDTAQSISQNQTVSREHISELQRSNTLMSQQLSVLMHIAQQGQSKQSSGNQVIVMPTTQSDDALAGQLSGMRSKGYQV